MKKKFSKMKPYTKRWEKMADAEARSFAPDIHACVTCGFPVVDGFCCANCGDNDPSRPTKTEQEGEVNLYIRYLESLNPEYVKAIELKMLKWSQERIWALEREKAELLENQAG